jgi:hypothetical protein
MRRETGTNVGDKETELGKRNRILYSVDRAS